MEKHSETSVNTGETSTESKPFNQKVEIGGLQFDFVGELPAGEGKYRWSLKIPTWQEQVVKINETISEEENTFRVSEALDFERTQGEIASIDIWVREKYLAIMHIESNTWILPEELGYKNAKGLGSFLLKSLTTLADTESLPVFIEPYPDGSSPLSDEETVKWYERNGFIMREKTADHKKLPSQDYGSMVRLPQSLGTEIK